MKRALGWLPAAIALGVTALGVGCASSSSPAPPKTEAPASAASAAPAKCAGTLGIEAGPITRAARKKLGLAEDARGALVTGVLPGGPAAAAGILPEDVIERIDSRSVVNDCEFDAAAFNRSSCGPVSVTVRRKGAMLEMTLVPVDQSAFLDKTCQAGNADACFREGWLLWSRRGGPRVERALEIFTAACKAGSAQACAYEALQLMDMPDKGAASLAAADRSCELGSGGGCATLAFLYATGKFVKKDDRRATTLYGKACDLGDPQGCYNAGLMAEDARGGPRDDARAAAKYQEACTLGSATGCTNLGRAYTSGTGVAKDEARAAEIFREACDRKLDPDDINAAENGAHGCSLLGGLYIAGDGIPKNIDKGRELSQLGCERGDAFGCFNASAVAADPAETAHYLDLACKAGDAEGCFDLGVAYAKGNGVAANSKTAADLYKRACQMGFAQACAKKKS